MENNYYAIEKIDNIHAFQELKDRAKKIYNMFKEKGIEDPYICWIECGGLQLEWHYGAWFLEIDFINIDTIGCFRGHNDQKETWVETDLYYKEEDKIKEWLNVWCEICGKEKEEVKSLNEEEFKKTIMDFHEKMGPIERKYPLILRNSRSVEVFLKSDMYYAEWIKNGVTLYKSQNNSEIVGFNVER